MGEAIKTMIADTPLVKNLNTPQYMDILLDGKTSLEERFAQIDIETVRRELQKSQEIPEKIPSEFKKVIKQPDFLQKIDRILHPRAKSG